MPNREDHIDPLVREVLEAFERAANHRQADLHQTNHPRANLPQANELFREGLSPPFPQFNHLVHHPLFDAIDRLKVNLALIKELEEDHDLFEQLYQNAFEEMRILEARGHRADYQTRARMALNKTRQLGHKRQAKQVYDAIIKDRNEIPHLSDSWAQTKALYARDMPPYIFVARVPQDIENELARTMAQVAALELQVVVGGHGLWKAE
ncbi:uncharacterized protein IWZ02DRAFT_431591 [Phyllosticta citriasiana]|uniref:uncharacterized protein n=1 Tax=Phyllosticta citriasiana TaxID=595635 RepID=UPI0030FDC2F2